VDTRICKVCGLEKPFDKEYFQTKYGKPIGRTCRVCSNSTQNKRRSNPDVRKLVNECSRLYWQNNKAARSIKNNNWKKLNRGKATAWNANYRAKMLQATPKWLTQADYALIKDIYLRAKLLTDLRRFQHPCGKGFQSFQHLTSPLNLF